MIETEHKMNVAYGKLEVAEELGFFLAVAAAGWIGSALNSNWYLLLFIPFYYIILMPYRDERNRAERAWSDDPDS